MIPRRFDHFCSLPGELDLAMLEDCEFHCMAYSALGFFVMLRPFVCNEK